MPHLILTGFMGSGKSTVGRMLAQELNLPFVDLDDEIKAQTGLSPRFYIPRFGEPAFRRIEKICLQQVLAKKPSVLAAGGGAMLDPVNRRLMRASGLVIWLDPPFGVIRQRLGAARGRPLLADNPVQIKALYKNRLPFYRRSPVRIGEAGPPQTVAISILRRYRQYACTRSS